MTVDVHGQDMGPMGIYLCSSEADLESALPYEMVQQVLDTRLIQGSPRYRSIMKMLGDSVPWPEENKQLLLRELRKVFKRHGRPWPVELGLPEESDDGDDDMDDDPYGLFALHGYGMAMEPDDEDMATGTNEEWETDDGASTVRSLEATDNVDSV